MIEIRKTWTQVETIFHEFGPAPAKPQVKAAVAAVLHNPFAGRYEPNILPMMEALKAVGLEMARRLLAAMKMPASDIQGYGKGAIVGADGELEHGALWHVPGGYAMRELLGWKDEAEQSTSTAQKKAGGAKAIVPSTKKVGGPSAKLDVPFTHINASYVRSHFDAMEVYVPGHPHSDELVYILVMSNSQRVHARVAGLSAEDVVGMDGLR
jgi:hypothetical protein